MKNPLALILVSLAVPAIPAILHGAPAAGDERPDRLCFVQFHHPGDEHVPDTPAMRTWNTGTHRRKFMKIRAAYLASPEGKPAEGDVVFWGEWEPPSLLVRQFENPARDEPRYLYRPVRGKFEKRNPPCRNTDPFVYGDRFLYGICKQNQKKGPTDLMYLRKGTVILFGSNRGGSRFVLDTVFVVDDSTPYTMEDYHEALKGKAPPEYIDIVLNTLAHELVLEKSPLHAFRLYSGATHDRPYHGMFSYFPCAQYREGDAHGFARPVIRLPGVIDDTLKGWQRMNPRENIDQVAALWKEVTRQVLAQGLSLGVRTDIPGFK